MKNKQEKIFDVVKKLYQNVTYSKSKLILMALTLALGTVGGIFLAATIGGAVEMVSTNTSFDFISVVFPIIIAAIISLSTSFFYTHLSGKFSAEIKRQMSNFTLKRLLQSRQSWIEIQKSGDLINKSGESLGLAVNLLTDDIPSLFDTFMAILLMAIYLFINNWVLAILYFALYPLVIYMQNAFSKPIKNTVTNRLEASSKCNNIAIDSLRNLTTVKVYGLETIMSKKYSEKGIILQGKFKRFYWVKSIVCFIGEFFAVIPTFIVCFGAVYFVSKGTIEVGALLSFVLVMLRLNSPLLYFGRQMAELRGDAAGAKRLIELWEAPLEDRSKKIVNAIDQNTVVDFKNVSFSYDGENKVLNDISFSLKKGEKIAFVGKSGCGKSTILKLISGLYETYSGAIDVLGHEVNKWQLLAMRKQIACVSQRSDLFPVTLYENIVWGSSHKTIEDVRIASKKAGILDFIEHLPEGFGTLAGERGVRLSGGQKQRVSIARAILRDFSLLLLDEATSSLDATTEKEVQKSLDQLMSHQSTIIVSHRLSSIRNVDRIYVIDDGIIVETGRHHDLMNKKGVYFKLYNRQLEEVLA